MYTRELRGVAVVLAVAFGSTAAFAQSPKLGKPISAAEVAAWDISVLPDGTGLPPPADSIDRIGMRVERPNVR